MRILYHHRTLGDGAEGIHIREMISAFRALGHEVRVTSLVGEGSDRWSNNTSRWSWVGRLLPDAAYELAEVGYNVVGRHMVAQAIRTFKPDFVYDRYNSYSSSAVEAARRAGIPVLLEVNAPLAFERTVYENHRHKLPRLAQWFERKILSHADRVFAVSSALKEFLVETVGLSQSQIIVLPNGADPRAFDPTIDNQPLRKRYGIGDRTVIGFIGGLRVWHGLEMLLEAFVRLVHEGHDTHLALLGDGPLKAVLEQKAGELGIADRVTFSGALKHADVAAHLALFDIAVSPRATFYASPMKILEYMAMARPVVAPRMTNICDILDDGKNAVLFEPENLDALTDAMCTLVADPELANRLGQAAREKVENSLNWRRNAMRVVDEAELLLRQSATERPKAC